MIPELISILKERKRVTLSDISVMAKIKEEVTEQIMEQLVRKKRVRKETIACTGCMKDCSSCIKRGDLIYYEIIE